MGDRGVRGRGRHRASRRPAVDDWERSVRRLHTLRRLQVAVPIALLVLFAVGFVAAMLALNAARDRQASAERSLELAGRISSLVDDEAVGFWKERAAGRSGLTVGLVPALIQVEALTGQLVAVEERDGDPAALAVVRRLGAVTGRVAERISSAPDGMAANWQQQADGLLTEWRGLLGRVTEVNAAEMRDARGEVEAVAVTAGVGLVVLAALLAAAAAVFWRILSGHIERILKAMRHIDGRARALAVNASDLVLVAGPDGRITYASPSAERALGWRPEEAVGAAMSDLTHPDDQGRLRALTPERTAPGRTSGPVEIRLRRADGSFLPVEGLVTNACEEPAIGGFIFNGRDVAERKAMEASLTHQAFHDSLTGLANRALLLDRLGHALRSGARDGRHTAVLLLDLDDFKTVNDSLGHEAGDRLLVTIAGRLAECIRAGDTAARLGGDEFALVVEGVAGPGEAEALAGRIIEEVGRPVDLDGHVLLLGTSIGVTIAEGLGRDAQGVLRDADAALYAAKADGKGRHRVFEPGMLHAAERRLELITDLHLALERSELELHYQPILRLADGVVAGAEALVRWRHPDRDLVPPSEFIPLSEDTGLIVPVGRWVLRTACREAAAWTAPGPDEGAPYVTVNVSPRQLDDGQFVGHVRAALAESGLPPHRLVLEITESCLSRRPEKALRVLQRLRQVGVRVALDDFGTGYSSLSQLARFPVDLVKIDRAFVADMSVGRGAGLAAAIVSMGDALGLQAVAEGIEDEGQLADLRSVGCTLGQGFLFSRPVPERDIRPLLGGVGEALPARE